MPKGFQAALKNLRTATSAVAAVQVASNGAGTTLVDAGFTPSTFTATAGGSGDIGISGLSTGSVTATADG